MPLGPESAHSPNVEDANALYWIGLAVIGVLGVVIHAALIGLVVRSRRRRGAEPKRVRSAARLQVIGAAGLGVLALALFVAGIAFNESSQKVEASGPEGLTDEAGEPQELEIDAIGQQWIWRYEYPNEGAEQADPSSPTGTSTRPAQFAATFSYEKLVVPVDTVVRVNLQSTDVVHRWWVPGLTLQTDARPGDTNTTWFKADETGTFEGASYQFSGPAFNTMRTQVEVVTVQEYRDWLERQAAEIEAAQEASERAEESGGVAAGETEETDEGA